MKLRFHSLDGLRGVCALAILFFHARILAGSQLFAHAYLSVDMFFLMSGFILSQAYENRLANAGDRNNFAFARIRRLAPSLWFGIALGMTFRAGIIWFAQPEDQLHGLIILAVLGILNALLLPIAGPSSQRDAFTPNTASWSLFAELVINAGFAFLSPLMKLRHLAIVTFGGALLLVLISRHHGTLDFGAQQDGVLLSVPRAIPTFTAGMMIHKLWARGTLECLPRMPPSLLYIGWLALMATYSGPLWLDLVLILIVAPVVLGLLVKSSDKISAGFVWLGAISYPLYATHTVILNFVLEAGLHSRAHGAAPWISMLAVASCIATAEFVRRWVEPGARIFFAMLLPKPKQAEIPDDMRIHLF